MSRSLSAKQARDRLKRPDSYLMLTYENGSPSYSLDNGFGVTKRAGAELTQCFVNQSDLFLAPSEDGLFPGFSQTWKDNSHA